MRKSIRQKINEAKTVYVYVDADYLQHDSAQPALLKVTKAQARRVVDMAPRDNPPSGIISDLGSLVLEPPSGKED